MSKDLVAGYVHPASLYRDDLFGRVSAEFDQFFNEFFSPNRSQRAARASYPKVDIYAEGTDIVLQAAVPGLKKDEIQIELENDTLTLSYTNTTPKPVRKNFLHEVKHSSWSRSFTLGANYPEPRAYLADGILTLVFHDVLQEAKTEKKRIAITD